MSIVLITFPAAPKPVKEDMEREKKFEEHIEKRTLGSQHKFFYLNNKINILLLCIRNFER